MPKSKLCLLSLSFFRSQHDLIIYANYFLIDIYVCYSPVYVLGEKTRGKA